MAKIQWVKKTSGLWKASLGLLEATIFREATVEGHFRWILRRGEDFTLEEGFEKNFDLAAHSAASRALQIFRDAALDLGEKLNEECSHKPKWDLATPAEGEEGIIDVPCAKCGVSGSFKAYPSDIQW